MIHSSHSSDYIEKAGGILLQLNDNFEVHKIRKSTMITLMSFVKRFVFELCKSWNLELPHTNPRLTAYLKMMRRKQAESKMSVADTFVLLNNQITPFRGNEWNRIAFIRVVVHRRSAS